MLTQLESLETQPQDKEANNNLVQETTQEQKAMKYNFAADSEAGGSSASMAAAAQASQRLASPCYFVVSYHCLSMTLVDEDSRSVKKCPMLAQDKCP